MNEQKRNTFGDMNTSGVDYILSGREETYVKHTNGLVTAVNNITEYDGTVVSNYISMPAFSAVSLERSRGCLLLVKMHQMHF